ncbi:hypothetical protein P4S72_13800 [Vibrio sp. PP-XX7]
MKLQNGAPQQPVLLCIPGAGDNVFAFMDLVQAMPSDWTILGLHPRGLWGDEVPHSRVEAAANFYHQALLPHLSAPSPYLSAPRFIFWDILSAAGLRYH